MHYNANYRFISIISKIYFPQFLTYNLNLITIVIDFLNKNNELFRIYSYQNLFFFSFFGHNDGFDIRSLFSLASIVFSRTKAKLIFWHASAAL